MKYTYFLSRIVGLAALILVILFPMAHVAEAACHNATSLLAVGSSVSISSICTVAQDTIAVADYATSQNSVNDAVTTITAAVTINSGSAATSTLGSGSFNIGVGGSIAIGSTKAQVKPDYPVWVTDGDADGWVGTAWTLSTATASGKWRVGLLKSIATLDCNDAAFSATNTCYGAFYPAFYPSFGPYGGFSPYGSFYPMFSP